MRRRLRPGFTPELQHAVAQRPQEGAIVRDEEHRALETAERFEQHLFSREIVAKKNLTIPGGPAPHAAVKARLEKLEGTAFDQVYMKAMVDGHTKILPTVREHLQMAPDIYKTVGSGMRSTSGAAAPRTKGTAGAAKPANPGAGHPPPDTMQPGGKPRY